MKKFKIWFKATVLSYPYWRVTYKDGERTRLLHFEEADGLALTFNGRVWIDYTAED